MAISVQWREERPLSPGVVNPTLIIMSLLSGDGQPRITCLVIDDQVEGAPDTVVRHIGDLESLLVDALTRQSRVTMDLDTERRSAHSGE